ncbi:MAG: homoserine dehydrogenase [Opitutales bacterium]|nr:homoserine dehydrogenase [Opitutales bacterium]
MSADTRKLIRIGLVGLGTVGQGVWKHLMAHKNEFEARIGGHLELTRAAVRDLELKREVEVPPQVLTTDPMDIALDPDIDILCELMGGTDLALRVTRAALQTGKTVVTANKALLCEHGSELFALAEENHTRIYYEASVAGGIPIIKALREGLAANQFPLIYGILNGTCNYILTRMQREGKGFEEIVDDARKLGYVEADEALDLDGWDAAHKTAILAFLAHGKWISLNDMPVEGIRDVTLEDIRLAERLGYKIKLLAEIIRDLKRDTVFASVQPALVPESMVLASVDDVFNAVSVTGDIVGESVYIGRGAGQDPTASAVLSDVVDAATALVNEAKNGLYHRKQKELQIAPLEAVCRPFYIRVVVKDEPGVLSEVSAILARHSISIESVLQTPSKVKGLAQLVMTTHSTSERSMRDALLEFEHDSCIQEKPFILRIADFEQSLN